MDKNRQRRFEATGKWFQKSKNKNTWQNWGFVGILLISFIFYLCNVDIRSD